MILNSEKKLITAGIPVRVHSLGILKENPPARYCELFLVLFQRFQFLLELRAVITSRKYGKCPLFAILFALFALFVNVNG